MGFDDFMDFDDDGFGGADMLLGMGIGVNMGYVLAEDGRRLAEEDAAEERRRQRVREILYGEDDEGLDEDEDVDYMARLSRYNSDDDDDDWHDEWEREDEDDW